MSLIQQTVDRLHSMATQGRVVETSSFSAVARELGTTQICLTTEGTWLFEASDASAVAQVKVTGRFQSNSTEVVREAVLSGLGIGFMPNWFFTQELASGLVERLLINHAPHPLPIHVLYPSSRRHSSKLMAFTTWTRDQLSKSL